MRGFTLIETLVAVLLLSISIAGPLSIVSKGLMATLVAKDQFIAFYLAQDAMEQVRYLRDSACLATASPCDVSTWLSSLGTWNGSSYGSSGCFSANGCYLDSLTVAAPISCGATCLIMQYNASTNSYVYAGGTQTPQQFIRTIKITNAAADEAVVTVTVTWTDVAGVTHQPVTVRENIFRWQ